MRRSPEDALRPIQVPYGCYTPDIVKVQYIYSTVTVHIQYRFMRRSPKAALRPIQVRCGCYTPNIVKVQYRYSTYTGGVYVLSTIQDSVYAGGVIAPCRRQALYVCTIDSTRPYYNVLSTHFLSYYVLRITYSGKRGPTYYVSCDVLYVAFSTAFSYWPTSASYRTLGLVQPTF